jgi:mono/diheme cytochrome c family protein
MLTRFSVIPALLLAAAAPLARAEEKVNYETQIQPIFAQHCVGCHGEEKPAAKLTLLSAAKLKEKWTADAHLGSSFPPTTRSGCRKRPIRFPRKLPT